MTKLGTVTETGSRKHIRTLRDTPGIYLDLVKSGSMFTEYVVTDGEWNPANEDGLRVYDRDEETWRTVPKDEYDG